MIYLFIEGKKKYFGLFSSGIKGFDVFLSIRMCGRSWITTLVRSANECMPLRIVTVILMCSSITASCATLIICICTLFHNGVVVFFLKVLKWFYSGMCLLSCSHRLSMASFSCRKSVSCILSLLS